jgi:LPXTG-site transpeptidase (sortase) family protein
MISLRTFNNILSVVIVLVIAFVLLSPFAAAAELWWKKRTDPHHGYAYKSQLLKSSPDNKKLKNIPQDNRLVMPQIQLDAPINEGRYYNTLNKGLWHRPGTGDPLTGGNTVIAGHRFTYQGASILFNLDKIREGDVLIVYWQHKEYDYKVARVLTASPLDLSIEQNTAGRLLTIYTCTPLWSSKERLVIQALPYEAKP